MQILPSELPRSKLQGSSLTLDSRLGGNDGISGDCAVTQGRVPAPLVGEIRVDWYLLAVLRQARL